MRASILCSLALAACVDPAPHTTGSADRVLVGNIDPTEADATLRANTSLPHSFGQAVAPAGDVNGDGIPDLIVGHQVDTPANLPRMGAAYIFLGPVTGSLDPSNAHATFLGAEDGDDVGAVVAGLGDVNGDGFDDIAMNNGLSFDIWFGPIAPGTFLAEDGDARRVAGTDITFRSSIQGADLDHDGIVDLLVGHMDHFTIEFGPIGSTPSPDVTFLPDIRATAVRTFGQDAAVGDFDDDGFADLAISHPEFDDTGNEGIVYIFEGPFTPGDSWRATDAQHTYRGEEGYDYHLSEHFRGQFGASMGAGDVDGDGHDDLVVGSSAGTVHVLSGANLVSAGGLSYPSQWLFNWIMSDSRESQFGTEVDVVGDVDGDGRDDVLVGQRNFGFLDGRGHLFYGSDDLFDEPLLDGDADVLFDAPPLGPPVFFQPQMGATVVGLGDMDGDGFADIAIAAPQQGEVYLFNGGTTSTTPPPLELDVGPLIAGGVMTLEVDGLQPNERAFIGMSLDGQVPSALCPPNLGGVCIDLVQPRLLGMVRADATGRGQLELSVPNQLPPGSVYLQAAVARGVDSLTSRVVVRQP